MDENEQKSSTDFKKPVLIGKLGHLPRKVLKTVKPSEPPAEAINTEDNEQDDAIEEDELPPQPSTNPLPLPYKEPSWSGLPETPNKEYTLEVLKYGSIIETINLMNKSLWVFGRLPACDVCMAHPTISRYHAALQYKQIPSEEQPKGFYLYDLNSTHGTFLNKLQLKSRMYVRVQVGHMIKLGSSSRSYILTGPEDDAEEVSNLSVTELKQLRAEELLKRQKDKEEAELKAKQDEELRKKKEEERGVNWGMGDDADEESDLTENPYAQPNNEELYIDDPKKALRGFMEREGIDFEYDCSEQGMGQFLCRVNLPIDDENGRPIVAEIIHKGKKKEAVIQCALEACRILDRHDLLRQATHESRKRKAKNWEENDFYDSDEDTFLDRTGTVEKKRENRMKAKLPQQPETYQSLTEKEQHFKQEIQSLERQLKHSSSKDSNKSSEAEDSLDSYMNELKQPKLDKEKIIDIKTRLNKLKLEYTQVVKLLNIVKPVSLPPLEPENKSPATKSSTKGKLPMFGKRIKVKVQKPVISEKNVNSNSESEDEAESSSDLITLESSFNNTVVSLPTAQMEALTLIWKNVNEASEKISDQQSSFLEKIINSIVGLAEPSYLVRLKKLINKLKDSDFIKEQMCSDLLEIVKDISFEHLNELEQEKKPKQKKESKKNAMDEDNINDEKKRKKNQRRIQQRQGKTEAEKIKGYKEDAMKEDYNMWVPPVGQTGDGRTTLNDKFGY